MCSSKRLCVLLSIGFLITTPACGDDNANAPTDTSDVGLSDTAALNTSTDGATHSDPDGATHLDPDMTSDSDATDDGQQAGPMLTFDQKLEADAFTTAGDVAVGPSGDVCLVGQTSADLANQTNAGDNDGYLARLSADGTLEWVQLIGTPESEDGEAVAMDDEGNCFVAGLTRGNLEDGSSDSSRDIFLAKYDAEGTERFIVEFGGDDYDKPTDLALVGDGGLVISGSTKGGFGGVTVDSGRAAFAAKLDEEGQLQWVGIAGGDGLDAGDAVAVDNTGAVYLGGADQSTGSGPTSDGFLAKFSEDGQQQWFKAVGTDRSGEVNAIVIGANGDIHAVGRAMGGIGEQTSEGRNDGFVATFAPDGANTQTSLFGSTDDEEPAAATLDDSGTLLVTGTQKIRRDGDRQTRGFLMKVELAGDVGWTETFSAYGAGVEIASNDAIFVGGTANPARGDREARLLKFQ